MRSSISLDEEAMLQFIAPNNFAYFGYGYSKQVQDLPEPAQHCVLQLTQEYGSVTVYEIPEIEQGHRRWCITGKAPRGKAPRVPVEYSEGFSRVDILRMTKEKISRHLFADICQEVFFKGRRVAILAIILCFLLLVLVDPLLSVLGVLLYFAGVRKDLQNQKQNMRRLMLRSGYVSA